MVGKYVGLPDSYLSVVKVNLETMNFRLCSSTNWISISFGLLCFSYFPLCRRPFFMHALHVHWSHRSNGLQLQILKTKVKNRYIPLMTWIFLIQSFKLFYHCFSFLICRLRKHMLMLGRSWRWEFLSQLSLLCVRFDLVHNLSTSLEKRRHSLPTI